MTLFLVRHASLCPKDANRYNGHLDISLCKEGKEMALTLAKKLDTMEFDAVFCSDLARAKETLMPSKYAKNAIYTPALREKSWGRHEGMSFNEIVASGLEYRDFESWIESLDGERMKDFTNNLKYFVSSYLPNVGKKKVLFITHGGVISALKNIYLGINLQEAFYEKIQHCEILEMKIV